jgi:hypothetical protein
VIVVTLEDAGADVSSLVDCSPQPTASVARRKSAPTQIMRVVRAAKVLC